MKTLFVAWQSPRRRAWIPVGRLTDRDGVFEFVYTRGAKSDPEFRPFGRMMDFHAVYRSEELFPLFANRVIARSRPEYAQYLDWLGLSGVDHSVLDELARTGGIRATDSLELFPCPEPASDSSYRVHFFARGLRYVHPENSKRAKNLERGTPLYLMRDLQNEHDPMALLLRTNSPATLVGYVPRYYSAEFSHLLELDGPEDVHVSVERVNAEAPLQYLVLCTLSASWPSGFVPCSGSEFQSLAH